MSNWKEDPEFLNYLKKGDSSIFMRRIIFNVFILIASTLSVLSVRFIGDWAIVPTVIVFAVCMISKVQFRQQLKNHYQNYKRNRPIRFVTMLLVLFPIFMYGQDFQTTVSTGRFKIRSLDTIKYNYIKPYDGVLGGKVDLKIYKLNDSEKMVIMYFDDKPINTYLVKFWKKVGTVDLYSVLVYSLNPSGLVLMQTRVLFIDTTKSARFGLVSNNAQVVFGQMELQDPKIFEQ